VVKMMSMSTQKTSRMPTPIPVPGHAPQLEESTFRATITQVKKRHFGRNLIGSVCSLVRAGGAGQKQPNEGTGQGPRLRFQFGVQGSML
jgi:hypothetical protein